MDMEHFWSIIEDSRKNISTSSADGNMERQAIALGDILVTLPLEEIVSFRDRFCECMDALFTYDLWGAAFIIGEGCSDDGFSDFRSWLISMGKAAFRKALVDADSVVDLASQANVEDIFFEEFQYIAGKSYERKMNHEIPEYTGESPEFPVGEKWSQYEDLLERLPKTCAEYHE